MKMRKRETIIGLSILLVCLIVGYSTDLFKSCDNKPKEIDTPIDSTRSCDTLSNPDPNPNPDPAPEPSPKPAPIDTIVPTPQEKDTIFFEKRKHRKTERDTIMDITYNVRFKGKVINSILTDVRPLDSTISKKTYVKPKPTPPIRMTKPEMKQMLRTGSDAGSDKLASNFRIVTQGQRAGEKIVESPMDVHDKIKFETWKDVKVISLIPDNDGRILVVNIQPVYY